MSTPNTNLDPEGDFLVKESSWMNYLIGAILLIIFTVVMVADQVSFVPALCLFLIPGLLCIARGNRHDKIILVNRKGIIYKNKLLTDWPHFSEAYLTQDQVPGSYQDNFVIEIRYYDRDTAELYEQKVSMSNTQDKSDEEIIEAINFYCQLYAKAGVVHTGNNS